MNVLKKAMELEKIADDMIESHELIIEGRKKFPELADDEITVLMEARLAELRNTMTLIKLTLEFGQDDEEAASMTEYARRKLSHLIRNRESAGAHNFTVKKK